MKFQLLAATALALVPVFGAEAAHAAPYIDTVNVTDPTFDGDGPVNGTYAQGASFQAASFNSGYALLNLGADNPGDGGFSQVYLVADNGTGGATGVAGAPLISLNGDGSYQGVDPAHSQLIGTIQDSSLAKFPGANSLVGINFTPTITSANDEYWIIVEPVSTGSAAKSSRLYFEQAGTGTAGANEGVGLAGQNDFFAATTNGNWQVNTVSDLYQGSGNGPYSLIVTVPEPASAAVLGASLIGLGVLRRRAGKKRAA